jgi:cellulose synthase/poly-beta-1,6-N-acetylglucosamine synthase-like glycosyltransferase
MHHRNSRADGQPLFLDTASASYRRDLFVDYGGFPEHSRYPVAEDSLFGLRLTADGQKLKLNPEAVVQHVGRTSLRAMFMQSFRRGQGEAVLMLVYPQHFTGPPSRGLRRLVHRWLNRLYDQAQRRSPLFFGLAAALRRGLFALPEITSYFMGRYLPSQMRRYAAMGLSRRRRALYWLLEWLDCLPKCAARTFYTFIYARSAARDGRRVPELHDAEGL